MRSLLITILLLTISAMLPAQEISVIKMKQLEKILSDKSSDVTIVNFWATWCGPCVKELPYFEKVNGEKDSSIKIILVSLDFADKIDRVIDFAKRKNLKSEIVLLDEIDYNSWIDKVDTSWEGAIPATLIKNNKTGKRKFIAKELEPGELEKIIDELNRS